jgi:hypothetical protein
MFRTDARHEVFVIQNLGESHYLFRTNEDELLLEIVGFLSSLDKQAEDPAQTLPKLDRSYQNRPCRIRIRTGPLRSAILASTVRHGRLRCETKGTFSATLRRLAGSMGVC